jgi:uncharacterized membrane protein YhiD involved in acid resistance
MDAREQAELVGKLLLAAFCGGFVGWQRDRHRYVAGLRTMALVAAGSMPPVPALDLASRSSPTSRRHGEQAFRSKMKCPG